MITKFISSMKAVFVCCFILFSVIACERDFENVGVSLVDNNLFNPKDSIFEVTVETKNDSISRVDNLPLYNLGIYKDPNFGLLNSSFVTQLGTLASLDSLKTRLNIVIDTVIIDIPYFSTRESEDNTDGTPNFSLDSIIGGDDFTLKVSRLATFLNSLDPNDPTQIKRYFSDESYTASNELYTGLFKLNENDTILFIKRPFFEGSESIDTIIKDDLSPSIKLPLNEVEIEKIFITEAPASGLSSLESFTAYFRGLLFEPESAVDNGSLVSLRMSDATFNIYYTYDVLTDEDETDLNGDGDTDDVQVPVKTKETITLPFSGIRAGIYDRDYTGAEIDNFINTVNVDPEKLFIQGAAGSNAEVEIQIDVDEIRAKNWLINGAFLDLYVDNINDENIPNQLYLYNVDNNSTIIDVISEAQVSGIGGFLQRDDDGKPLRYQFSITDYMSEILKPDSTIDIAKLAIKMYHTTDAPQSTLDTIIRDFSWNSQAVVLKGIKTLEDDGEDEYKKRIKLNIFYTETNN